MSQWICWSILVELWYSKSLLLCRHLLAIIWIDLSSHARHLHLHLHLISRSWLWLDIVVCRFDIHSLLINVVAIIAITVDTNELHLVFLSLVLVLELHLDKAKSTSSTCSSVSHDDCVGHNAELFEIFNEV